MRVPPDQSMTLAEHGGERLVGVARLERARHVGEPRAEQERVHALARVRDRVEEMQEQPRVLAHRAGDIEQRHDRRLLGLRPEIFQVDERAARLHAGAQRAAHVDDVAAPVRRKPARLDLVERQHQPLDRVLGGAISAALICAKSFFCSTSRSDTVRRASSSISRSSGGFVLSHAGEQRLLHALRAGLRRLGRRSRRLAASASRSACRDSARLRKKMRNAWSNSIECSWRFTNTACSVQ